MSHRLAASWRPDWFDRVPWPLVRRIAVIAFLAMVLGLVAVSAQRIEWAKVSTAVRGYSSTTLWMAFGLALVSHAVYSTFDFIGRQATGHDLPLQQVAGVAFISYAFNLNLGVLLGGVGFRYRLYSRLGLGNGTIARIVGLSILTNWLGYGCLAGTLFMLTPLSLPPNWKIGTEGLQVVGALVVALAVAYLLACAFARKRTLRFRGEVVELPSGRVAAWQASVATLNWALMGAVVYVLLQQRIDYVVVLSVLLIGAVAGIVARIPAGLGVLEAVFVLLLANQLPAGEVLAAVLTYRAIYYLAPLVAAGLLYALMEIHARRHASAVE